MSYSVIIPIYNEEKFLHRLTKQLKKLNNQYQIIIINDGSTDKTRQILNQENEFDVINNQENKGKGFSIRKGVTIAKYDNLIIIDGDLEININNIPKLIQVYEDCNGLTILGCRWNKIRLSFNSNNLGNFVINTLFNLLYNSKYYDVLCCVKIIKKDVFQKLKIVSEGFSIEVEILAKICFNKIDTKQILVDYKRRSVKQGKKIKILDGFKILYTILKLRVTGGY
tara:strand:+ start:1526 stop:2200 length:675 start_codon:yes stop_codon:yes gene_type:complete